MKVDVQFSWHYCRTAFIKLNIGELRFSTWYHHLVSRRMYHWIKVLSIACYSLMRLQWIEITVQPMIGMWKIHRRRIVIHLTDELLFASFIRCGRMHSLRHRYGSLTSLPLAAAAASMCQWPAEMSYRNRIERCLVSFHYRLFFHCM